MTIEQQLETLKKMRNDVCEDSEDDQALYYAIRAIEALTEPKTDLQPTCNQLATDCISRQAAIDATWSEPSYTDPLNILTEVRDRLKVLPSAQPERKKGMWKRWYETLEDASGVTYIPRCQCSECGTEYDPNSAKFINFCPQCGADMRGEQE